MGIEENFEEAGGCLFMGEISSDLREFLLAKQKGILLNKDYPDSIKNL
ncbi:MAG: hypothetical protein KKF48_01435 [Nanoarchaeota archaeon]|nr:hypothetical protein [Nanoarchaeota archaeon]MBU1027684.1 hypothetical protein [Nanoarchaeota archaeon]